MAGVTLTWHDLAGVAVAVACALGLRILLYRTRAGLAMRAAVDDRPLAMLNGSSPHGSAMLAWAIGCTTAAVAGILVAPTVGLSHVNLALMIVNAYAAAMIGRLRSLPMTVVGALALGLLDAYALAYVPTERLLLAQFRFAIPVVVLFVVLLALPHGRLRGHSTRTTREVVPRPPWSGSLAMAALFVAAGVVAASIASEPDALALQKIVAVAIIGLSLVPLVGFAGQLSLCQMSFAGIGAILMAHHGQGGSLTGLVVATVGTGLVGALVALPTVRIAGIYLALATAAFAMLLDQWVFGLRDFAVGPVEVRIFSTGSIPVDAAGRAGRRHPGRHAGVPRRGVRRAVPRRRGHPPLDVRPAAAGAEGQPGRQRHPRHQHHAREAGGVHALRGDGGLRGRPLRRDARRRRTPNFAFVQSLPLLLVGVVGGIGTAAGALAAGVLIGGLPLLVEAAPWFENVNRILPGTMGIALGRNPNGLAHSLRESLAPLRRQRILLAGTVVGVVAVVGLRLGDVITGGVFAAALAAELVAGGLAASLREARRRPPEPAAPGEDDLPLEWAGLARPFTAAEVATLDRELGLDARPGRPVAEAVHR